MTTLDLQIFVQNVESRCKALGILPTIACRESGVGNSFLSMVKAGSAPSIIKAQKLAAYLGVTTSDLLGEKQDGPNADSDAEAALDRELISRLVELTPEELEKVDAFVQGLLAAR